MHAECARAFVHCANEPEALVAYAAVRAEGGARDGTRSCPMGLARSAPMKTPLPKIAPRRKRLPLTRSQMMARIRSDDTRPEMATRAAVHALGLRFRKHVAALPGKPDLANRKHKWAIFVHGCFWHSHRGCKLASQPKTNAAYWDPKLRRNKARDIEKIAALRTLGFKVLVLWECDVRGGKALRRLRRFFDARVFRRGCERYRRNMI
jgi:DNA mismatch endonuclease (patch repair protein)